MEKRNNKKKSDCEKNEYVAKLKAVLEEINIMIERKEKEQKEISNSTTNLQMKLFTIREQQKKFEMQAVAEKKQIKANAEAIIKRNHEEKLLNEELARLKRRVEAKKEEYLNKVTALNAKHAQILGNTNQIKQKINEDRATLLRKIEAVADHKKKMQIQYIQAAEQDQKQRAHQLAIDKREKQIKQIITEKSPTK